MVQSGILTRHNPWPGSGRLRKSTKYIPFWKIWVVTLVKRSEPQTRNSTSMGRSSKTRKHRHSSSDDDDGDDTANSSSSSPSPSTSHKRRRRRKERNERSKRKRESKHRRSRRDRRKRVSESEDGSRSSTDEDSELRRSRVEPRAVVRYILKKFPGVATDLEQVCKFWILFRNPNFDYLGWILLLFFFCFF